MKTLTEPSIAEHALHIAKLNDLLLGSEYVWMQCEEQGRYVNDPERSDSGRQVLIT